MQYTDIGLHRYFSCCSRRSLPGLSLRTAVAGDSLSVTTVVTQILVAIVGLAKLYEPAEVRVDVWLILEIGLSTVSAVVWIVR
jgi:hypothetical protein